MLKKTMFDEIENRLLQSDLKQNWTAHAKAVVVFLEAYFKFYTKSETAFRVCHKIIFVKTVFFINWTKLLLALQEQAIFLHHQINKLSLFNSKLINNFLLST